MDAAAFHAVRQTPLFASLTDGQLDCISLGEVIDVPAGTVLVKEGDSPRIFYLTLCGEVHITHTYDHQEVLMAVNRANGFMGEIAILLDTPWLATARVSKSARFFRLNREGFWKMLSSCPSVAREVFRTAADRFRNLEGYASQREKLISLGTMAAGLAHELNNPASAALRAASDLRGATDHVQSFLCDLSHDLEMIAWDPLIAATEEAEQRVNAGAPPRVALEPVERSDCEDAMGAWLEQHQVADGWKLAPTFVETGLDIPWLEKLVSQLPPATIPAALGWLEARLDVKLLLRQVEQSVTRVSALVKAVKSYSHMDKSPMQEVDIHEGLESTLLMLGHKLKGVALTKVFDRSIPRLMAYPGELNQVWTNLIDNAIHAINGTGKLCVGTFLENDQVVVEIVDNGAGIPKDVQAHMFEPFFTTKEVGSGTGLGLMISNRIIADRHGGEIEFESKPGETRFRVRLPLVRPELVK